MPRVRFFPSGSDTEVRPGATILAAADRSRVTIGQSCSGEGTCGWCRVIVVEGKDNLAPPTALEERLMAEKGFEGNERAACLARVRGDVAVTTSYW